MFHPEYQLYMAEIEHQRLIAAARHYRDYRAAVSGTHTLWSRLFGFHGAAATTETAAPATRMISAPAGECS